MTTESVHIPGGNVPAQAVPASLIYAEPVRWLWTERIPLGALTLLVGDPGLGKSLLTVTLAAGLSIGQLGPAGTSLLVTAEDAIAATVVPRLQAAAADLVVSASIEGLGMASNKASCFPTTRPNSRVSSRNTRRNS